MAVIVSTRANYWINPTALSITLNALGEPNRIQASVASGAVIMCYIRGVEGLDFDNGHNYRRWPLTISPTYFNSNTEKYLYVAIPRSNTIGSDAMVVFPSQKLDIYGYAVEEDPETHEQSQGEQLGTDGYYYIWLQGIITSSGNGGNTPREWREGARPDTGILRTDEATDSTETHWYRWDPITQTVTFLKDIWMDATSVFKNLRLTKMIFNGHELNGVAVKDVTPSDSDDTIVTPAYLDGLTDGKYLRKDQDDRTEFSLGVGGDLTVGGVFDAIEGKINRLMSHNYSGSGVGDTGWLLTNDDGSGNSLLEVDNLLVRMKATFMELEIRKETFVGGNSHYSPAGSVIFKVDFIASDGHKMGYREQRVPWLLKGIAFLFPWKGIRASYTRKRYLRYAYSLSDLPTDPSNPDYVGNVAAMRCYLISDDGTTATRNWWQVGDQPRSQSFNKALSRANKKDNSYDTSTPGTEDPTSPISSDFWWRMITAVGAAEGDDGKMYDWIDLPYEDRKRADGSDYYSNTEKNSFRAAGSDIPKAGDTIVCMGNRYNADRMNMVSIISVATDDYDAPSIKGYRGIHTFSFEGCLVFNISPKEVAFRSNEFRFITDKGDYLPAVLDRGEWFIGERYHWYDRVSHNGSMWLCIILDGYLWVNAQGTEYDPVRKKWIYPDGTTHDAGDMTDVLEGEGEYTYTANDWQIPSLDGDGVLDGDEVYSGQDHYYRRATVGSQQIYYVRKYTYAEPKDTNDAIWLKQVSKGTEITQTIISYAASSSGTTIPTTGWKTVGDGAGEYATPDAAIAATGIKPGQYLWMRRAVYYSDRLEPVVEYSVNRWGIDGDGISKIDSYYWATKDVKSMPADDTMKMPGDAGYDTATKEQKWFATFDALATAWGGVGQMQGMFVWEKTVIHYDLPDGKPSSEQKPDVVSYKCSRIGQDGQIGQEEYYCLRSSADFNTAFGGTTYDKCGIRWYNPASPGAENWRLSTTTPNINTAIWGTSRPAYQAGSADKYLWNFEQRVDGQGTEYATKPVCIGDASRGIAGVIELYALSASQTPVSASILVPADINQKNTYGVIPASGFNDPQVWGDEKYDRAPTEALPYQWNWTRVLYTTPKDASDTARYTYNGVNYPYEDHYHVSAVKGTRGEDGAGTEYIYYRPQSNDAAGNELPVTVPDPNAEMRDKDGVTRTTQYIKETDDFVPYGWTDNPVGIDFQHRIEYQAERKSSAKTGTGGFTGGHEWGAFTQGKPWSKYGKNGVDGDGVEYVFARTAVKTPPTISNSSDTYGGKTYLDDDYLPAVSGAKTISGGTVVDATRATDNPQGVTRELPYEWVMKRTKGLPNAESGKRNWNKYTEGEQMTIWNNLAENAIRMDLSNEMDVVKTDSNGKVDADADIVTVVRVFDGSQAATIGNPVVDAISIKAVNGTVTTLSPYITPSGNSTEKTLTWKFLKGMTISSKYDITIRYTYLGVQRLATFTIVASMGQAIYQLRPSASEMSFTRQSDNTLKAPAALSLIVSKLDGVGSGNMSDFSATGTVDGGRVFVRYSKTSMPTSETDGTAWPQGNQIALTVAEVTSNNPVENIYIAMFNSDSTLLDRETIPVVKDGLNGSQGPKGNDGVSPDGFSLVTNPSAVNFRTDATGSFVTTDDVTVVCKPVRTVGNVVTEGTTGNYYLCHRLVYPKSTGTWTLGVSGEDVTDSQQVGLQAATRSGDYMVVGVDFVLSSQQRAGGTIIASVRVPVMVDGRRGAEGATGRMFYSMGEWTAKTYTRTEDIVPIVHYGQVWNENIGTYGKYYYLNDDSANANEIPGVSSKWAEAVDYGIVIAQGIFAPFAKLGKGIFSNDYFFSMNGHIGDTEYNNAAPIEEGGRPAYTYFVDYYKGNESYVNVTGATNSSRIVLKKWTLPAGVKISYTAKFSFISSGTVGIRICKGNTFVGSNVNFTNSSKGPKSDEYTTTELAEYSIEYLASAASVVASFEFDFALPDHVFEPNWMVDLLTGKMVAARGNFVVDGSGNVEVKGTVRAKNLFHGVCIVNKTKYSTKMYYCRSLQTMIDNDALEGWNDHTLYSVGNYYEWNAEREAGHYGTPPDGFVPCTYDADIVITPNLYNNIQDRNVYLPCAKDFEGKIVEVIDDAYTNGQTMGSIIVRAADEGKFGGGIDENGVEYLNTKATILPGNKSRFYSIYDGGEWWWLQLP
jgi:hypothetical protein